MAKSKRTARKAKTKDKTDDAEMRSPELEGLVLNDDDFDLHFASIKRAVEAMKRTKNGYDACCKAAKKVSPALLDAIKFAVKLEGMDPIDVKRELEIKGYALKRTGSSLQLTIHDTLLGDVADAAFARGEKAGTAGLPMANPYPDGSDLAMQYQNGWAAGQSQMSLLTQQAAE